MPHSVHLIGIGGSGMSSLAECLLQLGLSVSGSDLQLNETTKALTNNGAIIFEGHARAHIRNAQLVIVSDAISKANIELNEASLLNIPILSRVACLDLICQNKNTVMVSGSHGKTTTSSMVTCILKANGADPSFSLGADILDLDSTRAHIGDGKHFVAEACEAFRNLYHFHPNIAVITNIDNEHLNHYGSQRELDTAFLAFANRAKQSVVINGDDIGAQRIIGRIKQKIISYGFSNENTLIAYDYISQPNGSIFKVKIGDALLGVIELIIPGHHVAMNAICSIATCLELGIDFQTIAKSLHAFTGASRRWERYPSSNGQIIIDDFAHHPTQIAAIAQTAITSREANQRLIIAFQPQLYSRTKSMLNEFGRELARFDLVLLLEIDSAGEMSNEKISSSELAQVITQFSGKVELYPDVDTLINDATHIFKENDFIIIAGPGNINSLAKKLSAPKVNDDSVAKVTEEPISAFIENISETKLASEIVELTVLSLFKEQVDMRSNNTAIRQDDQVFSYAQLDLISNKYAEILHSKGVNAGDTIGVYMRPCMESAILTVAIAKIGAIYLPIDTAIPGDRAQYMLDESKAKLVITNLGSIKNAQTLSLREINESVLSNTTASTNQIFHTSIASDIAYICFTSGTTGKPKGIPIHHGALVNLVLGTRDRFSINSESKTLFNTALSFDVSLGEIWITLCGGGELCCPGSDRPLAGEQLGNFIQSLEISHLILTPSLLNTIQIRSFPFLKYIIVAGEACPQKLADAWAPNYVFFNAYGPTEATIYTSVARCHATQPVTIGEPLPNITTYILDTTLNKTTFGSMGEIYIGGIGLSRGYINLPHETKERFIWLNNERLYRTGDLGRRLKSGEIEYLGRIDNQVKILGHRIELEEVESVVKGFSEIADAIIAVDERLDGKDLVCFAVLSDPLIFDWPNFREKLSGWLPTFMLPTHFIPVNEIPLTPNGKRNRTGLLSKYRNRLYQRLDFTAPRTPTEIRLLALWKNCLQVDFDIGVYENFISMGGDSLKGLELLTEVESEFNVLFPVGYFGRISTIWRMAAMLDELSWVFSNAKENETDLFTSSRIYRGLRDTTAGWKGGRKNEDSIIVSIGEVEAKHQVYLCLQTYEELSSIAWCLGDRFRVHGMRSGHLLTDYNAQDTEKICNYYVTEILTISSSRKIILGGICQGGKIAIRIAELLRERGIEIDLLILAEQMHLEPTPEKIAFFYSEDSKINPFRRFPDRLNTYDSLYGERYSVDIVPGIHGTIHREPQVYIMTDKIKQYLGFSDDLAIEHTQINKDLTATANTKLLEASGLFSASYYTSQFSNDHYFKFGPAYDYVTNGWHKGLDPCPFFSSLGYLRRSPDVMAAGVNPLVHFLQHGIREGRIGWTEQDILIWQKDWNNNPDLALQIINSNSKDWPLLKSGQVVNIYTHSRGHMVFNEIQELLIQGFSAIGIECLKGDEKSIKKRGFFLGESNLKIIIAPHEFFFLNDAPKSEDVDWNRAILLNSEQLPSTWLRKALPFLLKARFVLDMNVQTAASLSQLGINVRFLPLGYVPGKPTSQGLRRTPLFHREIDLLWVGTNSERRERFMAQHPSLFADRKNFIRLVKAGLTLSADDPESISSAEFAGLGQRSKILLNVHHFDTPYFEWQRLIHFGLLQGCCVVTETVSRPPGLMPGVHYFEESNSNLPELVAWLLDDPEGRECAEKVSAAGHQAAIDLYPLDQTLTKLFDII
nr:UDP-N-acetylmuramate--L-alanine ligase [Polynucleobacter paneuropaeus]